MQGKRRVTLAAGAVVAAGALAVPAIAGPPPTTIAVGDDFFDPSNATQLAESSTNWAWNDDIDDDHNVRQDDKLFNSGSPTDNPGASYQVNLPSGSFHYYCTEHGSKNGGMDGTVKVKPIAGGISADGFPVIWGNNFATAHHYDVQFKVGNGKWKNWRKDTIDTSGLFGDGDVPVDVKPGKTYRIRARTEAMNNPDRRSDWSPTLKVIVET